ncbi:hypothetical protein C8T65DRAFT_646813 [Cerioporus squamosus]|nr:hypothetical protein C8T65DRAFT_646813 [Cerioporus squamosus]
MRVAMLEAKDKALLAAREEIVSLKEALQPEASSASATQSISVQTGKENIASAAVDFSEDTFPASAALTSGGLRPHLARLP